MILVLLGTHELPFKRLVAEIERLKKEAIIKEEVVVQNGHTAYKSEVLTLKQFVSYEEMEKLVDEARLIITHAGTGSVISALKKGKKVIAVPRLKKYGEHNDDHQLELAQTFLEKGHVLLYRDSDDLGSIIEQTVAFIPEPFQSEQGKMFSILKDFIDNV